MNLNPPVTKSIGVVLPLLVISGSLGVSLSVPRVARANTGHSFLETMGISIAVGTVLGASTLPFYDQPGKHLENLAYGASAGAVTGLGIMVYGWIAGPGQDEFGAVGIDPAASSSHPLNFVGGSAPRASDGTGPAIARNDFVAPRAGAVYPAQFWTPLVSLNW